MISGTEVWMNENFVRKLEFTLWSSFSYKEKCFTKYDLVIVKLRFINAVPIK